LLVVCVSVAFGKHILGIEGKCLGTLCEDLRLDLVKLNLPNPIPPVHLFQVVEKKSDKEEMALGRFSTYNAKDQLYYLITVEHEQLDNFYEIFTANVTAGITTNATLKLWRIAELTSVMFDSSSGKIYAVVDGSIVTIQPATGQVTSLVQVVDTAEYKPLLPAAFDPVKGNYFFSAKQMSTSLHVIVTYNVNTKSVTITPPVGGTDPITAAYPIEMAYIPTLDRLYLLVNSNMGGGMESVNYLTGEWTNVVVPGHFYEPYDVPNLQENKNQEACYDPVDDWWYILMWDYTDPEFPLGVLLPWDIKKGKWATGAWSVSDDVSNWAFVTD